MYVRKVKSEERCVPYALEESFRTLKASITWKQMCQPVKEFTQSFTAHSLDTWGVCRQFSRRIGLYRVGEPTDS